MPSDEAQGWSFPSDLPDFLRDLKANNNRAWFLANKKRYEQSMKKSAAAFGGLLSDELGRITGHKIKHKIFRINRDLRFSKDKTPYNTHLHMSLFSQDAVDGPHYMVGIEPGSLSLGAGVFAFKGAALDQFRKRIAGSEGQELKAIVEKLRDGSARISEPDLKRVPAGYEAFGTKAELLRHKGIAAWIDNEDADVATRPGIVGYCSTQFERLKPLADWLAG